MIGKALAIFLCVLGGDLKAASSGTGLSLSEKEAALLEPAQSIAGSSGELQWLDADGDGQREAIVCKKRNLKALPSEESFDTNGLEFYWVHSAGKTSVAEKFFSYTYDYRYDPEKTVWTVPSKFGPPYVLVTDFQVGEDAPIYDAKIFQIQDGVLAKIGSFQFEESCRQCEGPQIRVWVAALQGQDGFEVMSQERAPCEPSWAESLQHASNGCGTYYSNRWFKDGQGFLTQAETLTQTAEAAYEFATRASVGETGDPFLLRSQWYDGMQEKYRAQLADPAQKGSVRRKLVALLGTPYRDGLMDAAERREAQALAVGAEKADDRQLLDRLAKSISLRKKVQERGAPE